MPNIGVGSLRDIVPKLTCQKFRLPTFECASSCVGILAFEMKSLRNQAEMKEMLQQLLRKLPVTTENDPLPIPVSTLDALHSFLYDWCEVDGNRQRLVGETRTHT